MKSFFNRILLPVLIVVAVVAASWATGEMVQDGKILTLTWSTTSPTITSSARGVPVVKTSGKSTGGIVGVALSGSGTASENVPVAVEGVFDLSVTSASAPIAVGDYIFVAVPGTAEICTAALSDTNSGLIYGVALEPVASGATTVINVLLRQPSHL